MKTVLVIEDEAQTRNIFLQCLEFEGFRALGAENGTGGIELVQQQHPDLVVCDIMMPDIDGYSVLSTLRKSQDTAAIPLIFLTAKVTMADLRQGMELGADDYLTKPCTVEQFLVAINTRLNRQAQLAQLYQQKPPQTYHSASQEARHSGILAADTDTDIFPHCPKLETVFHFIEENFHRSINLSDVAKKAGYSAAYLTNLVQAETGRSVKQWIIERRMAEARKLLKQTTQSVRQVAEASGYSDAGYFSRQFRQSHGATPLAWRQRL
jgi:YesN/AraC family two-component response regulator